MPQSFLLQKSARGTHFIALDPSTVKALTKGGNKRIICQINGTTTLHAAPGNKRGILYLVSKFKTVDKRIEKSLQVAAYLKRGITSPREMK